MNKVTVIAVALAMLISIVALMGWLFNIEALYTFNANWPSIKPNTSLGIIFSGVSLQLFIRKRKGPALILAMIVFLTGVVTAGEYLFHINAHIDELLFIDKGTPLANHHGRMARLTTIAFILSGIALLTYPGKLKWIQRVSEISAIMVFVMSLTGFVGALYKAGQMFRIENIASFSVPTALCGLFLSVAILFSKPDFGFLSAFQKQTGVAKTAIKGILIIITILIVIGWLCLKGEQIGIFDREMGFVIMIIIFTVSFLFVTRYGVQRLSQSENLLIASETNLRHILSSTADIFYVVDRNYRITLINDSAEKRLYKAWGKQVKAGDNIFDLIPHESDEPIRKSFQKVFNGEKVEYELHLNAEEPAKWVLVNYKPVLDYDGTVIGAYIDTKDITERKKAEIELKKSEERYRSLIEQASDFIMITDQKGNFLDANTSFFKTFGFTKDELSSINISKVIDPEQLKNDPVRFDLLLLGQSVLRERKMRQKDGTIIEVEANVKMLPDGRILAIARDITERKRSKDELEQSYKAIRQLTEHIQNIREIERTHIAREIHDELGQQLTVLKMDVSWIINELALPDDNSIKQKLQSLIALLDNTLSSVRRISSELRPSLLDDMGLVTAMQWHLKEFEKRSAIRTLFEKPQEEISLPDNIKTGLYRIFQESLTNVARHANAKRIDVSLQLINGELILQIEDDGRGFNKEEAVNKNTLGILGMEERSFMMGGHYMVSTEPGKGTLITVSVPYKN